MAQNPVALRPDPASHPRPHRPALVATPGASEWVSCVSSPATNRSGRTLEKGAGNLANPPAAFQISLTIQLTNGRCRSINPPSAREPDLISTLVKGDRRAYIT